MFNPSGRLVKKKKTTVNFINCLQNYNLTTVAHFFTMTVLPIPSKFHNIAVKFHDNVIFLSIKDKMLKINLDFQWTQNTVQNFVRQTNQNNYLILYIL